MMNNSGVLVNYHDWDPHLHYINVEVSCWSLAIKRSQTFGTVYFIGFMCGIFTYIYDKNQLHVGIYHTWILWVFNCISKFYIQMSKIWKSNNKKSQPLKNLHSLPAPKNARCFAKMMSVPSSQTTQRSRWRHDLPPRQSFVAENCQKVTTRSRIICHGVTKKETWINSWLLNSYCKSVGLYIWFRYWESSGSPCRCMGCVTQWERPDFCTCFLILGKQRPPTSVVWFHDVTWSSKSWRCESFNDGSIKIGRETRREGKHIEKKRLVLMGRHGASMFEWLPPFTPSCMIHLLCNCRGILIRRISCSECRSGFHMVSEKFMLLCRLDAKQKFALVMVSITCEFHPYLGRLVTVSWSRCWDTPPNDSGDVSQDPQSFLFRCWVY